MDTSWIRKNMSTSWIIGKLDRAWLAVARSGTADLESRLCWAGDFETVEISPAGTVWADSGWLSQEELDNLVRAIDGAD